MKLPLQATLRATHLLGDLPFYSNSFPTMTPPHRSCADCSRMSAYLSAAASGSGCESVVFRVSLPACRRGPFPPSSARASTSCSWGQVLPGWGQVEGRHRSRKWQVGVRKVLVQGPRLSQQGITVPLCGQPLRPFLAIFPDCLNLSDLLAVVQLSLQADLSVRLDVCRQVSGR